MSDLEYKVGDRVSYHPIGGASDKVASSKGEIMGIKGEGDETRYTIKNDNTGKKTSYQAKNITGKVE